MAKRRHTRRLLAYTDVPPWQQDKYILHGYRPLSHSYPVSLQSLLYVHNQTVNIYTHLIGLAIFSLTACSFRDSLTTRYHTASHEDTIVFSAFFAGLFACLGFSSAFHTFSNHSRGAFEQWLVLDFLGILCLVAGSWVPGVYYGFYCHRPIAIFYMAMISSLCIVCAMLLLVPHLRTPKWQSCRTAMFVSLGVSGIFPMAYAATEFGISQAHLQLGWGWFVLEGVFYISGAVVYVCKYPEKAWPGACDIVGSSHQIFHVLVLLGAVSHFTGIVRAFEYNHSPVTRLC